MQVEPTPRNSELPAHPAGMVRVHWPVAEQQAPSEGLQMAAGMQTEPAPRNVLAPEHPLGVVKLHDPAALQHAPRQALAGTHTVSSP